MKTVLSLLLISVASVISKITIVAQIPSKKTYLLPYYKTDTSRNNEREGYFRESNKTSFLVDLLIAKKVQVDKENLSLKIEVKRLKKINEFLKNNSDTIQVHDTVFKKRNFFKFFKKLKL